MGAQRIDFNHVIDWIITQLHFIGATTNTTTRFLAETDTSKYIYLAPNGNDTNEGLTPTTPVLTLARALNRVDHYLGINGRYVIHVISNGFSGDISFLNNTTSIVTDNTGLFFLQTELGTIATIDTRNGGHLINGRFSNINGIRFLFNFTTNQLVEYIKNAYTITGLKSLTLDWCSFINGPLRTKSVRSNYLSLHFFRTPSPGRISHCFFDGRISNPSSSYSADDNAFYANVDAFNTSANASIINIDHCIFANYDNTYIGSLNTNNPSTMFFEPSFYNTNTLHIDHTTFFNCTTLTSYYLSNGAATNAIIMSELIVSRCTYLSTMLSSSITTISISNALIDLIDKTFGVFATSYTNTIDGVDPLFWDTSSSDYRLQDVRNYIPNTSVHWFFTSQAVLSLTTGNDFAWGAISQSYSFTSDTWETTNWENEFWNDEVTIEENLVNHQSFYDLRGNFHRTFDQPKRKITFKTNPQNWTGSSGSYELKHLIESNGAKRWYPNGNDGIAYNSVLTNLIFGTDNTYLYSLPFNATIPSLVPNSFKGFIATLSSGAASVSLRIKNHQSSNFLLEDHRGNQIFSSGSYNFRILYLPIEISQPQTPIVWDNWDPQLNPLMIPSNARGVHHSEGNIRTLVVEECELDI